MIKVYKSDRFGYTPGCWWISEAIAKKLCGGTLPKIGWERKVKEEEGYIVYPRFRMPHTFTAWVENISGHFRLRDENGILNVREFDHVGSKS